jgi:hypothetical protein
MFKTVGRQKPISESASSRQRSSTTFPIDHILIWWYSLACNARLKNQVGQRSYKTTVKF